MKQQKNRFHTQHTGTYNNHIHVRQTHQPVYELDEETNKLKLKEKVDIQKERNLFIQDVNYKSAFEINDKGELKNKNYEGNPNPMYGDITQLPTDIVGVKELADARLDSVQEQLLQAIGVGTKKLNEKQKLEKYNKKIEALAKIKTQTQEVTTNG